LSHLKTNPIELIALPPLKKVIKAALISDSTKTKNGETHCPKNILISVN